MSSPREILLKILEIIEFSKDKEKFVTELLQIIFIQSLADLIQSQNPIDQTKIKAEIASNVSNPDTVAIIMRKYFSKEKIDQALENSAKNVMTEYLTTINPALSDDQRSKITKMFQELKSPTTVV